MLKAAFLIALAGLSSASPIWHDHEITQAPLSGPAVGAGSKVNVTLYVMSRCPDARLCESVFDDVLQTKGLSSKVNLNMGYIGQHNESSPLGLQCKHGPLECIGNAHQLCMHKHLPLTDFYAVLSCMNYQTPFPSDIGTVGLAKRCIKTVGLDWQSSGVGQCIEGKGDKSEGLAKEGYGLLVDSVDGTLADNVTTSCTIKIDSKIVKGGKRVCQVDGGVWSGCDDGHAASDFVRVIEDEWKKLQ